MSLPALAPIATSRRRVLAGETSVRALVEGFIARARAGDETLAGFSCLDGNGAIDQAARMDAALRQGAAAGPLLGAVMSVKDIIDVAGLATTCCSHSRLGLMAQEDAPLVQMLRKAGAIIIGKANCHEFAFGGPAFDLPFPPARNPWNPALFPGGSSSGSGVTVAAGFCNASIGTDTAGSIRLPSTHCGLAGLKPTRDAVALDGVAVLSGTMDSAGPLARHVDDCRRIFAAIASRPESHPAPAEAKRWRKGELTGLRLGLVDAAWRFAERFDASVAGTYSRVLAHLSEAGATLVEVEPPGFERLHAISSVIMMAEIAANYAAQVRGSFSRFGEVFRSRALLGEMVTAAHYEQALRDRATVTRAFAELFTRVDVILMPGSFAVAGPLQTVDKFYFLQAPNINAIANLTGCPALALPTELSTERVPMGIQLMGAPHSEAVLLAAGEGLERRFGFAAQFQ